MDQSRCKYRLRSKGSLTNVTQPPPGFSGAFQPAFVLVVGDRWRDEPWWTSGATPRLLLSEYVKYAASGFGVRLADMRIEVPEASDQSPPALRRPATAQANQAITFIREWCIGLQPCLHEAIGGKRADQFVGRGFVPRFCRQQPKQPIGDELVPLRRPMPADGLRRDRRPHRQRRQRGCARPQDARANAASVVCRPTRNLAPLASTNSLILSTSRSVGSGTCSAGCRSFR